MNSAVRPKHDSTCTTGNFTVRASPFYLADKSNPEERRYVFAYRMTIECHGPVEAQLLSRRWLICDAEGHTHTVEGDGVIGMQPSFSDGVTFQYTSYCPLATRWGTMEGSFTMAKPDGETFEIAIARFYLVAPGDA
ncbi:MAG: Co2+/Mg2+ efflux protein ApaG [Phycisphaerae bacterium]|jgi:ApaG protein